MTLIVFPKICNPSGSFVAETPTNVSTGNNVFYVVSVYPQKKTQFRNNHNKMLSYTHFFPFMSPVVVTQFATTATREEAAQNEIP